MMKNRSIELLKFVNFYKLIVDFNGFKKLLCGMWFKDSSR